MLAATILVSLRVPAHKDSNRLHWPDCTFSRYQVLQVPVPQGNTCQVDQDK